jgi:RNA polymerase sigma-70 factor, ECF subfamily
MERKGETSLTSDQILKLEWAMNVHGEKLMRLAYTYVKDKYIAENILQDVFLNAFEKQHQFQDKSSYETYLYRITVNRCKGYLKSWSFKRLFFTEHIPERNMSTSTEEMFIRFEEDFELGEQILSLPIKYREVIIFYFYFNYSVSEMSSTLKLSERTIYTRLRRARERLKNNLAEQAGDYID